jgi:hypothetical protein
MERSPTSTSNARDHREKENIPGIGLDLRLDDSVRHSNRWWGAVVDCVEGRGGVGYQRAIGERRDVCRKKEESVSKWKAEDADELLVEGKASTWWG